MPLSFPVGTFTRWRGKTAQLQLAAAAKMLRMNADSAAPIVKVIEAAQQTMDRLANVAAGIGGNLDISV